MGWEWLRQISRQGPDSRTFHSDAQCRGLLCFYDAPLGGGGIKCPRSYLPPPLNGAHAQRVLNDLESASLSRRRMNWLLPHPLPPLTGHTQKGWERETTCWREKGRGVGGGAKWYDGEKAWSSINHSIPSAQAGCFTFQVASLGSFIHIIFSPPPRPRHPHCPVYARKHFPVLKINVASGAAQAGHWRQQKGQPILTTVHIELHLRRTPLVQIQYCFMVILVKVDAVTNLLNLLSF